MALDVASRSDAARIVAALGQGCDFYKVGLQLFVSEGPRVVEWLRGEGKKVFLDLKLHDIPSTVRGAAAAAAQHGADLLTVHASGGQEMLHAAVEGAGTRTTILGVTVLTSFDLDRYRTATGSAAATVEGEVLRLAGVARDAGAGGVVCAGTEAAAVRAAHGSHLGVLVPGIRVAGGPSHDQARTVTPAEAAKAGVWWMVIGRAVTAAPDPAAAFDALVASARA